TPQGVVRSGTYGSGNVSDLKLVVGSNLPSPVMGHPKHGREIINTLLPETFVHLLVHFVQRDGGQVHGIQVMADGAFEERTAFADHFFAGYPIGKAFVTRDENLATTIFAVLVFGNDEQVIGVQYA